MSARNLPLKGCLPPLILFTALLACPNGIAAQNLELSGGYAHVSGDFGLDGFSVGAAWWFTNRVAVAANYDGVYDTSRIGMFEFTSVGAIASKSHLQDFLIGPRFFFTPQKIDKYRISPFGELQFGLTHLKSTIQEGPSPAASNSDTAFSWMLGAGADYRFNSHWAARLNLDLLRTHLNNEGQSRLRLGLGVNYSFGARTR